MPFYLSGPLTAIINSFVQALTVYASIHRIIHVKMTSTELQKIERKCGHACPERALKDGRLSISGDDLRQGLPPYFLSSIDPEWLNDVYRDCVGMTIKASTIAKEDLQKSDPGAVEYNSFLFSVT